ncbi:unnamed protein product [Polarella glacialis]|uniref:Uncharacterized protein n=1 Tax=Polarella glacialis TaxID=89957 RepID=A0A813LN35_POLGL|nr:unnamed protein product [Polarella glacialis]
MPALAALPRNKLLAARAAMLRSGLDDAPESRQVPRTVSMVQSADRRAASPMAELATSHGLRTAPAGFAFNSVAGQMPQEQVLLQTSTPRQAIGAQSASEGLASLASRISKELRINAVIRTPPCNRVRSGRSGGAALPVDGETPEKCRKLQPVPLGPMFRDGAEKRARTEEPAEAAANGALRAEAVEFVPTAARGEVFSPPLPAPDLMPPLFMAAVARMLCSYGADAFPLTMPPVLPSGIQGIPSLPAFAHFADAAPALRPVTATAAALAAEDPLLQRTLSLLRCMLDCFFETHMVQYHRHIFAIVEQQLGSRAQARRGPLFKEELGRARFSLKDLHGLDSRIAGLIDKLPAELLERHCLGPLLRPRNLAWVEAGVPGWCLTKPQELRCMIQADGSDRSGVTIDVMSYSINWSTQDLSASGQQRRQRLELLLRSRDTGILCLQGLDAKGDGKLFTDTLVGEGYSKVCASDGKGEANTILWNCSRWSLLASHEHGSAVAVDLLSQEDSRLIIRVACLRPKLLDCADPAILDHVIASPLPSAARQMCERFGAEPPLLACADLGHLGGAEAAALVPGLLGLRSAMYEVLGAEVAAPRPMKVASQSAGSQPSLRRLWNPSSVLFRGVSATAALSSHTEGHLSTLSEEAAELQFPAGHISLWANFSWVSPRG